MMKLVDYNRLDDTERLAGWRFTDLINALCREAAGKFMKCECPEPSGCLHAAAASLLGIMRIVQHPDDCEECAKIRANDAH